MVVLSFKMPGEWSTCIRSVAQLTPSPFCCSILNHRAMISLEIGKYCPVPSFVLMNDRRRTMNSHLLVVSGVSTHHLMRKPRRIHNGCIEVEVVP